MDDLWISAILKHRERVPLILLGGNKSGLDPYSKMETNPERRPPCRGTTQRLEKTQVV